MTDKYSFRPLWIALLSELRKKAVAQLAKRSAIALNNAQANVPPAGALALAYCVVFTVVRWKTLVGASRV